ncbi:peritrophin-44 isoform X2 [Leptinotarsa decemlineata]|uniref:peritrophin-44 isoform X2 n=1 Tax=Leptinotarsa decemlineata TaxID=7539 RepID=UPI003D30B640
MGGSRLFVSKLCGAVLLELCLIFSVVCEQSGSNALPTAENSRCLKPTGQFPSKACNKFVNCWSGIAIEQNCPDGLLFSSRGYCDHPQNVNCNGRPIEGTATTSIFSDTVPSSTSPPLSSSVGPSSTTMWATPTSSSSATIIQSPDQSLKKKCLKARGQFPSTYCNKYLNCWDDTVVEQECPEGLLFSPKGYCDYPANVNCGDRVKSEVALSENASPSECPLEYGTFRDKTNCSSYFTCAGNKVVSRYGCHEGFKFNDNIGVCDYENRVDCSKEPLIFQRQTNNLGSDVKDDRIDSDCAVEFGTFRDKNNCSTYYTCVAYKIISKHDCPPGFYFNDDIGVCDYFNRVNCEQPPKIFQLRSNFVQQLPEEYMKKINDCTPGTIVRLNPQCTAACLCRNGVAEIIQCPAGFAYDSLSDKCVSPHLANC